MRNRLLQVVRCRYIFFFQAEDGIRDIGVTGVQTCALPICAASTTALHLLKSGDHVIACDDMYGGSFRLMDKVIRHNGIEFSFVDITNVETFKRSEERREGKSVDLGGRRIIKKKK